jgi:predicted Zn finger-like uncharacterized protein
MIITCPNCSTSYKIPDNSIPPDGKKVKCAKCGNLWHEQDKAQQELKKIAQAMKEQEEIYAEAPPRPVRVKPASAVKKEEVKNQQSSFKIWYITSIAAVFIAIIVGFAIVKMDYLVTNYPVVENIYELFGVYSTEGIKLQDIKTGVNPNDKNKFFVQAKIVNTANIDRVLPIIQIQIYATTGERLADIELQSGTKIILKPNQVFTIFKDFDIGGYEVAKSNISIGNKIEMMLR